EDLEGVLSEAYKKRDELKNKSPSCLGEVDSIILECKDGSWDWDFEFKTIKSILGVFLYVYDENTTASTYIKKKILEKIQNSDIDERLLQEINEMISNIKNYIEEDYNKAKILESEKDRKILLEVKVGGKLIKHKEILTFLNNSSTFINNFNLNKNKEILEQERLETILRGSCIQYFSTNLWCVDLLLKECEKDNWENNKDDNIAIMIAIFSCAYRSNGDTEKVLERIKNSGVSDKLLQETFQVMNNMKSGIENGKFTIKNSLSRDYIVSEDGNDKIALPKKDTLDMLEQSIKFISNNKLIKGENKSSIKPLEQQPVAQTNPLFHISSNQIPFGSGTFYCKSKRYGEKQSTQQPIIQPKSEPVPQQQIAPTNNSILSKTELPTIVRQQPTVRQKPVPQQPQIDNIRVQPLYYARSLHQEISQQPKISNTRLHTPSLHAGIISQPSQKGGFPNYRFFPYNRIKESVERQQQIELKK
ncbi:MAG: hypothetical protein LBC92_02650, partial [Rickettsiales bacterium]|nr:hypothetical protein [Rickettsiales bacterium]